MAVLKLIYSTSFLATIFYSNWIKDLLQWRRKQPSLSPNGRTWSPASVLEQKYHCRGARRVERKRYRAPCSALLWSCLGVISILAKRTTLFRWQITVLFSRMHLRHSRAPHAVECSIKHFNCPSHPPAKRRQVNCAPGNKQRNERFWNRYKNDQITDF